MKAATVLRRAYAMIEENEKAQILRGLTALLQTTTLKTERMYLVKAINYIEKH